MSYFVEKASYIDHDKYVYRSIDKRGCISATRASIDTCCW